VLRRAENVTLSRALFGRVTVQVGKKQYTLQRRPTKEQWMYDRARQQSDPVLTLSLADRNLWQFQGRFYWDNDGLSASQVYALLVTRGMREQQRIERAQAVVAMGSLPRGRVRQGVPDDLKQLVWQRDSGRCRHCGSQHELQYDHIIPLSMGGATSAENLQILCGPCNRRKGAGLTVRLWDASEDRQRAEPRVLLSRDVDGGMSSAERCAGPRWWLNEQACACSWRMPTR